MQYATKCIRTSFNIIIETCSIRNEIDDFKINVIFYGEVSASPLFKMKITFYIVAPRRRKLKFDSANFLDDYIKTHKFTPDAKITMYEDNKLIGEMLITRYKKFKHEDECGKNI